MTALQELTATAAIFEPYKTNLALNPQPSNAPSSVLVEWEPRYGWDRTFQVGTVSYAEFSTSASTARAGRGFQAHGNPQATSPPAYTDTALSVDANRPIGIGIQLRSNVTPGPMRIHARVYSDAGAWVTDTLGGEVIDMLPSDTWTRVNTIITPDAGGYLAFMVTFGDGIDLAAGDYLRAAEMMIEVDGDGTDYFSGYTFDTATDQYSWTGTPTASPSRWDKLIPRAISEGTLTLDDRRAPYGYGDMVVPFQGTDYLDSLDPREHCDVHVDLATTDEAGATDTRRATLTLRSREVDFRGRTATFTLATREALLQDYAPLTTDRTPREHEGSLRDVINYVLGVVTGGTDTLFPGVNDYDLTAYWPVTNLMPDPDIGPAAPGQNYIAGNNATDVIRDTGVGLGGSSIRWTALSAGWSWLDCRFHTVTEGRSYVLSAYVLSYGTTVDLYYDFVNADGVTLTNGFGGNPVTEYQQWTRTHCIVEAPRGADRLRFRVVFNADGAGAWCWTDQLMLHEGEELVDYFDGDDMWDGEYEYQWDGDPNAGTSSRIPYLERPPEALVWDAGTTAWDFLDPLLTAADMRLFCDETGTWRLVTPDYEVQDTLTVDASTATEGMDRIARDGETYVTGAIVRYRWTAHGEIREAVDTAGTGGRVHIIDYNRPYPGPGAAAAALRSLTARGRSQSASTLPDLTARPGMTVDMLFPNLWPHTGTLTAVRYNLSSRIMGITLRGLQEIVIPAGGEQ